MKSIRSGSNSMETREEVRLQVYLARCGIGSRRGCERFIEKGLVTVDGVVITTLGTKVRGDESIRFRGNIAKLEERKRYVLVNKPKGYLCSATDNRGRPVVSELFSNTIFERLFHVGRLDFNSEGAVFYSNDGEFARIVTHPSSQIEKEYLVESPNRIESDILESWKRGIKYEGEVYKIDSFETRGHHRAILRLHEGKNREIRQLFSSAGYRVGSLKRTRIGIVGTKGLAAGESRELKKHEVEWFLARGQER